MSSPSFPNFSPFSDALMAALASRSHDWKSWELSEKIEFKDEIPQARDQLYSDLEAKITCACTIQKSNGSWVLAECELSNQASPSLFLENVLGENTNLTSKMTSSQSLEYHFFERELKKLKNSKTVFDVNENLELSEYWLKVTSLKNNDKIPHQDRPFFLHLKNSKGTYRQALCTIF